MGAPRVVTFGLYVANEKILSAKETLSAFLSSKINVYARILFTLRYYLVEYSKSFDEALILYFSNEYIRRNGRLTGLYGKINNSQVDIGVRPAIMSDDLKEICDFSYPYGFHSFTFMIQKPEYEPQIFGIFQTFSLPLWMSIISMLIAISLIYYVTLKSKYRVSKIVLHVFAIFLRQSSILRPSSWAENLFIYAWVIGAMFICLAYDSVFLSFLTFPPIKPINDLSDLAAAVTKGEYHCFIPENSNVKNWMLESDRETLKIIATDIQNTNIIITKKLFQDFFLEKKRLKLAFLISGENHDVARAANKFASEDSFFESMYAMTVRKDFCCKELLDNFILKLMASGLYLKYENDKSFLLRMNFENKFPVKDRSKRTLTLIDVAPAFIALLVGYFISFVVFIGEMVHNGNKKDEMF